MPPTSIQASPFERFRRALDTPDLIDALRLGLIGENTSISGQNGPKPLIYADYVASGRPLQQVESFVFEEVLPYYANSHTEASFCGQMMTQMRHQARQIIAESCGADAAHAVIFTGSGATAGINRLVGLLGAAGVNENGERAVVIIGPYEHHSNILPWRESGAEIIEIPEAVEGGPDMDVLADALKANKGRLTIGAFSAMSNVTGIVSNVEQITRLLKSHGALSVWDYAGGAPYLPIRMSSGPGAEIDAIVVSPHKFIGGPGASGVLILRRDAVTRRKPTLPGGGTVSFVSPWTYEYSTDVVAREEAGTPNVIGDLRAALCFMVKDAIGPKYMADRLETLRQRALAAWANIPGLRILGNQTAHHIIPIFSILVTGADGKPLHQQLVTRMLSDLYGVQARGGCACAGPYGHRLLGIGQDQSKLLQQSILDGKEIQKPGWSRLGFSVLMSDAKADKVISAVDSVARTPRSARPTYRVDESTARFSVETAHA